MGSTDPQPSGSAPPDRGRVGASHLQEHLLSQVEISHSFHGYGKVLFAFPSKVLYIQELLQSNTPLSWVWLRDLNGRPQTSGFSSSPDLGPGRGLAAPSLSSPVGRCTAAPS